MLSEGAEKNEAPIDAMFMTEAGPCVDVIKTPAASEPLPHALQQPAQPADQRTEQQVQPNFLLVQAQLVGLHQLENLPMVSVESFGKGGPQSFHQPPNSEQLEHTDADHLKPVQRPLQVVPHREMQQDADGQAERLPNLDPTTVPQISLQERRRLNSKRWYGKPENREKHKQRATLYSKDPCKIRERYVRELNNGLLEWSKIKDSTKAKYNLKLGSDGTYS